jgi:hypothetical protein
MPPSSANLLFNEVIVVEEPLGCGRDSPPAPQCIGYEVGRFSQDLFVLAETGQEKVNPTPTRGQVMRIGQPSGMLLQLVDAEQFRAQWLFSISSSRNISTIHR